MMIYIYIIIIITTVKTEEVVIELCRNVYNKKKESENTSL